MFQKICFVYYWATTGGVERVFLNRGEALLRRYPNLQIELYFRNDLGGLPPIERYLKARQLSERFRVTRTFDSSWYDAIFIVDSPQMLENHAARGTVVALPAVPFENSHILMRMVRQKNGVFVSCSKGESFGLSAAEAMTAGLPVILSDIPPHSALVAHREKFLYRLGDVPQLARKMAGAMERYDELAAECGELSREFSEQAFLTDWERLFTGAAGA